MARQLNDRISRDPRFEIAAPTVLSVVCFRLRGGDDANRRLLDRINASPRFYLSNTVLNGRFVLRIAIGNLWTTQATIDELWQFIVDSL
jgi:aromatic-L-amino-acid decarboxylase